MGNNESSGFFALGLLVGGIIGALIGLLLAPKPGAETRAEIWERSELWRSRADEAAASLRDRVAPAASGVSSRIGPAVDTVRERGEAMAGTVRDAGASALDAARSGGSAAIDSVASRIGRGQSETESVGCAFNTVNGRTLLVAAVYVSFPSQNAETCQSGRPTEASVGKKAFVNILPLELSAAA